MQGKHFLFERSELNRLTPTMLFEKWEFGKKELTNVSTNLLSQFNLSGKPQFGESNSNVSFFATPPMAKNPASTPNAPIKVKKQRKKIDMKPKKLQYNEEEPDAAISKDSGVYTDSGDALFGKPHAVRCTRFEPSQKQIRTLRSKLNRIKVQSNDKENDRNVIGQKSDGNRNNVAQVSPVVFNSNVEVLSQCDKNASWNDTLHWLQPRRDVGLWIECCNKLCNKWRYVEDYHDPVDVPEYWYCRMNSDKTMASCKIPQQHRSAAVISDLIENTYNAGSIVWAHIRGYPWWPGIINDCPETFTYYKLRKGSILPVKYYVTFFNENTLDCDWIGKKSIKPFATNPYSEVIKRTTYHGIDYKSSLKEAYETALSALPLSILQRLQKFSFLARYERLYDVNNNSNESVKNFNATEMDTSLDEEIPSSYPTDQIITLKDYYLKVLHNRKDTQ